jgi:hypothetical protein
MYLCHSNLVKALRSIYTRINQLFEQILAQGESKSVENKKGNNLSKQGQSKTPITNKGSSIRVKKGNPVPNSILKKPK